MGARISANDWADGGLGPDDAVAYARELERAGFDYVCVSSGGLVSHARLNVGRATRFPFAHHVKKHTSLSIRTVGMIADAAQAEAIVAEGKADMVAMARAFLDDPRWVWRAAERFGVRSTIRRSTRAPATTRGRGRSWRGHASSRCRPCSEQSRYAG